MKGPEATAGSMPSFERVKGTIEANIPEIVIDTIIESPTMHPTAAGSPLKKANPELNNPTKNPQQIPSSIATRTSFQITRKRRVLSK